MASSHFENHPHATVKCANIEMIAKSEKTAKAFNSNKAEISLLH